MANAKSGKSTKQAQGNPPNIWQSFGYFEREQTLRTSVPGGWLVRTLGPNAVISFVSDPDHIWSPPSFDPISPIRTGNLLKLTLAVDNRQPAQPPGQHLGNPYVWINLRQFVSVQDVPLGDQIGKSTVKTLAGEFKVWQLPEEIALASTW